jgi:hypothetical protein
MRKFFFLFFEFFFFHFFFSLSLEVGRSQVDRSILWTLRGTYSSLFLSFILQVVRYWYHLFEERESLGAHQENTPIIT